MMTQHALYDITKGVFGSYVETVNGVRIIPFRQIRLIAARLRETLDAHGATEAELRELALVLCAAWQMCPELEPHAQEDMSKAFWEGFGQMPLHDSGMVLH